MVPLGRDWRLAMSANQQSFSFRDRRSIQFLTYSSYAVARTLPLKK